MKKSTKIISTAIAFVLVLGFMVVGIYAATSASAGISANVSWTSKDSLNFSFSMDSNGSESDSSIYINVDTTTTNAAASGISKALSLEFQDLTPEDGVNNPEPIYLLCVLSNRTGTVVSTDSYPPEVEGGKTVTMNFTSIPQASDYIDIVYGYYEASPDGFSADDVYNYLNSTDGWDSSPSSLYADPQKGESMPPNGALAIKLTIKNPDVSFSGVKLNFGLSFS